MQTPPLVGRELDLAVALEQLKRVERGAPSSLLVRGEAGIGKSRLVAELAARAAALGHTVVSGRADDLDAGIPYALFRDLLGRLGVATDAGAALRDAFDGDVSTVFAAAVRLLRDVAADTTTVLVLEDLHVADRESLALVSLVVRLGDAPILTVVTVRPDGGAADVERLLDQMAFDGRGAVLDLDRLDRSDTLAVTGSVLGAVPEEALVDAVYAASAGNPFFACEVARSFTEAGAVSIDGGRARLVAGVPAVGLRPSTALLRRLVAGTPGDVELAKVMAVFGRFPLRHLDLVRRLTGQDEDEVVHSFDRLVKAGLLVATTAGYEFTHSIVRDTLYEDIGPAERRRIHAAVATELAKDRRAGIVLDVLELATHVAASAEPGDVAAAEVLLDAGRAVSRTAPLVSAEYHGRAVELLPLDSALRPDALANQARTLHLGGRPHEAATVGETALAVLTHDAPVRAATVALVVNDRYLGGGVTDALAVIDAELSAGAAPCPLLAMRTNLALQEGLLDDATATFPDALASLDAPDVPDASLLMAMTHLVQYANNVGEVEVANGLLARVSELAKGESSTVALTAHELLAFADWRPGLVARMEQHLDVARALRPDAVMLSIGGGSENARLRLRWMQGEWDDALDDVRQVAFALEQQGASSSADLVHCAGCEILIDRGDVDAAAVELSRVSTSIVSIRRNAALVRARLDRALGDVASARAGLQAIREDSARPGATVWKRAEALRELVELDVEAGRHEDAVVVAAELEALADRTGWLESRVAALGARAVVDRDVGAAKALAELADGEGWAVERARATLLLGELDDDPARNLTDAYRWFDGFGAAPWRRRAAAGLRARALTVPRRAAVHAADLTDTEVQLVRLVRDGLSNRQIATAMHYSPKTIEVYLSRVYAKTGCASRLDLIRAVDSGAVRVGDEV